MFQGDVAALQRSEARAKKWAYLTEGIKSDYMKNVTEILLDNEERAIQNLKEESDTTNIANFQTFAYPLIRKVFPGSILNEIASVQPMTQPAAKVFFLDFTYGTAPLAGQSVAQYDVRAKDYSNQGLPATSEGALPKEINWQMSDAIIAAITRKLRAVWTIESQQDLKAYHGLDAESELTTVMAEEIKREVEGDVIWDMCLNAGTNVQWNATPSGTPDYVNQKAYEAKIYESILDAANAIYKKRYTYPNFLIADPDTCTRLEKLEKFNTSTVGTDRFQIGRTAFGTLNNKFDIFKDPWMPIKANDSTHSFVGRMLMGFKGQSWFQTGYVYAPYIPILITPVMMDPNDFKPRRGIMTRYGKSAVVPEMFATIDVYNPIVP